MRVILPPALCAPLLLVLGTTPSTGLGTLGDSAGADPEATIPSSPPPRVPRLAEVVMPAESVWGSLGSRSVRGWEFLSHLEEKSFLTCTR